MARADAVTATVRETVQNVVARAVNTAMARASAASVPVMVSALLALAPAMLG